MQIDRILYPITSLGPGDRLAIWTLGCSKHCKDCASPELWNCNPNKEVFVDDLISLIRKSINGNIDGVTITGGDPLEQPDELLKLVRELSKITSDILLYTGYTYEELTRIFDNDYLTELQKHVSVLIDGKYICELNDNECVLCGSSNQNLIFFDKTIEKNYSDYINQGRKIQNVFFNNKIMSVGIHNRD